MNDFIIKEKTENGKTTYNVQFTTDDIDNMKLVLGVIRWCVDREENKNE